MKIDFAPGAARVARERTLRETTHRDLADPGRVIEAFDRSVQPRPLSAATRLVGFLVFE